MTQKDDETRSQVSRQASRRRSRHNDVPKSASASPTLSPSRAQCKWKLVAAEAEPKEAEHKKTHVIRSTSRGGGTDARGGESERCANAKCMRCRDCWLCHVARAATARLGSAVTNNVSLKECGSVCERTRIQSEATAISVRLATCEGD